MAHTYKPEQNNERMFPHFITKRFPSTLRKFKTFVKFQAQSQLPTLPKFKTLAKFTVIVTFLLCSFFTVTAQQVTISGTALKYGQTKHDSIMVILARTTPSAYNDTIYTDSTGHFEKIIPSGIYNVNYKGNCVSTNFIKNQYYYGNTILDTINLMQSSFTGQISGVLIKNNYYICCNQLVNENDTLVIQAGCKFYFCNGAQIIVKGTLIANGTKNDSIYFLDYDKTSGGVLFDCTTLKLSKLNFVSLNNPSITSSYSSNDARLELLIQNSTFLNNSCLVLTTSYGIVTIENCYFSNITQCEFSYVSCQGIFKNSLFKEGFRNRTNGNCIFYNCIFFNNGINRNNNNNLFFYNCLFTKIKNNLLIDYPDYGVFTFKNCLFYKNNFSSIAAYHFNITSSLFYGNTSLNNFSDTVMGKIVGKLQNGSSIDAYLNVFDAEPIFADTTKNDYHTIAGSPTIDAGDLTFISDSIDFEGKTRIIDGDQNGVSIIDIGPYEFNPLSKTIPVSSITIDSKIGVIIGKQANIQQSILPQNASYKNLKWISSNPLIATVNSNGTITGIAKGTATVYAQAVDSLHQKSNECVVTVSEIPVTNVSLNKTDIALVKAQTYQLSATVLPAEASIKTVTWASTDNAIATVSATGLVTVVKAGVAFISATSVSGSIAAQCKITVAQNAIVADSINIVPSSLSLKQQVPTALQFHTLPDSASTINITWLVLDNPIASCDASGIVTGLKPGSTKVVATLKNAQNTLVSSDTCIVKIGASNAPTANETSPIAIPQNGKTTINVKPYASDDLTANLTWKATSSANLSVSVVNAVATITPAKNFTGVEIISFTASDAEGLSVDVLQKVSVTADTNQPASNEIPNITTSTAETKVTLPIADYISDDFTPSANLQVSVVGTQNVQAVVQNGEIVLTNVNPTWTGTDSIMISISDGITITVKRIAFTVVGGVLPNTKPAFVQIPQQVADSVFGFKPLSLNWYVYDDFTLPHNLKWQIKGSKNINITLQNNTLFAEKAFPEWFGTENIWICATDESGLTDSALIRYECPIQTSVSNTATSKPIISFGVAKPIVMRNEKVSFNATCIAATSWQWTFRNIKDSLSNDISPEVMYSTPGKYTAILTASNAHGTTTVRHDSCITVVGLNMTDTTLCKNSNITLEFVSDGFDSYKWNTGETTKSINVNPKKTTSYSVKATKGLFTFVDSIKIATPQAVELGKDSSLCSNDSLILHPGLYKNYSWNGGTFGKQQSFVAQPNSKITLMVADAYGCISFDTITISKRSEAKPSLGKDTIICQGKPLVLNPGTFAKYLWNDGSLNATKSVNNEGTYSVSVTNVDGCKATKSINIKVLQPYAEQIGLVTYDSLKGKNVIIAWNRHAGKRTERYKLLRESGTLNVWDTVAVARFSDKALIVDNSADLDVQAYRYKLLTIDSTCHNVAESKIHRTMHLRTSISTQGWVNLDWNSYVGLDLTSYSIMKMYPNGSSTILNKQANNAADLSYTDKVFTLGARYRILYDLPEVVYPSSSLKFDSGPFSISLSNMAESELTEGELSENDGVTISPNPASEYVTISAGNEKAFSVTVIDVLGRIVSTANGNGILKLDCSNLSKGLYVVKIQTVDLVQTKSLIIE